MGNSTQLIFDFMFSFFVYFNVHFRRVKESFHDSQSIIHQ
nr:MAG TPA: hypothetical protein [Myoviridae sp. ctfuG5]